MTYDAAEGHFHGDSFDLAGPIQENGRFEGSWPGEKQDLKPGAPGPHSKKPPMHALPIDRMGGQARAHCYGDNKYKVRNWVGTAKEPDRYIGAALRHLSAIMAGEMIDAESGLPHVNHLQCCATILEEALRNSGLLTWEPEGDK
jgi:hypothetical protein